ncbi:MAG: hypothetical protein OIF50_09005 [Flavobacteriaceae bacterium]|nr:hypothetical protein [Flavobacteriaceae bacterium]
MKNSQFALVLFLIISLGSSCNKEDQPKPTTTPPESLDLNAKWNIPDSTNVYDSMEFSASGHYIVVAHQKNNKSQPTAKGYTYYYGTYTILEDDIVALSDLGQIKNLHLEGDYFNFDFYPTDESTTSISIQAIRADEMVSTPKTSLFCRTWDLFQIDGETTQNTGFDISVLFSAAGTYYVHYHNPSNPNKLGDMAGWKWSDASEKFILYSWDNPPVWDTSTKAEIISLTDSYLRIDQTWAGSILKTYEFRPTTGPLQTTKVSFFQNIPRNHKDGLFFE